MNADDADGLGHGELGPDRPGRRERLLEIVNQRGLHARASARFAETAARFDARITVTREGLSVSGASIMGLLMLAAARGAQIHVVAEGSDAAAAMTALEALVAGRFDEDA